MSDISQRLKELERVAKAKEPNEGYKDIYPLMPLEFTKLEKQGEPEQALTEIWHEVIDDYEQEHLAELKEHLQANPNCLPPWRCLVPLSDRPRNGSGQVEPQTERRTLYNQLTKRALELYERRKSEGKIWPNAERLKVSECPITIITGHRKRT